MATARRAKKPATKRTPKPKAPEVRPTDAIIVLIRRDDKGSTQLDLDVSGDVRETEIPFLLEKAVALARARSGLPPIS